MFSGLTFPSGVTAMLVRCISTGDTRSCLCCNFAQAASWFFQQVYSVLLTVLLMFHPHWRCVIQAGHPSSPAGGQIRHMYMTCTIISGHLVVILQRFLSTSKSKDIALLVQGKCFTLEWNLVTMTRSPGLIPITCLMKAWITGRRLTIVDVQSPQQNENKYPFPMIYLRSSQLKNLRNLFPLPGQKFSLFS